MKTGRKISSIIGVNILRLCILVSLGFIGAFIIILFAKGGSKISLEFLFTMPRNGMTEGGIFPALLGTLYLTGLAILFAFPLGVMTAIFLVEYARPPWLVHWVRLAINTLASVPSVVFGLFGAIVFVNVFNFGVSMLAGSLTLGILILPIIIKASEEAVKAVPLDFREASMGLGATKRETILKIVVPTALPSMLTGAILGVGRAAGETAPIIFTAATFFSIRLPDSLFDEVMALPYHIYALMTEGTSPMKQTAIAWGSAIVLMLLVLTINAIAIILRYFLRRNKKW